jgi:hypothetical protein
VQPPDLLSGEEEVAPAADLPAAEAAPAGSSAVAAPAGSAVERSPDPPLWPRPPDLLAGGRVRRASRLGMPPHLAPLPLLSARSRGSKQRGRGGVASGGAVLRVAVAWEGGRGVGVVVGGGVGGRAVGVWVGGGVGGRERRLWPGEGRAFI